MESILGIDLTQSPAKAVVLKIENGKITIVGQAAIPVGHAFSRTALLRGDAVDLAANAPAAKASDASLVEETVNLEVDSESREALRLLSASWDNVVVIASPYDFLSLNLALPFADKRSIAKIINLEVQDRVPFEIDDLLISHSVLGPLPESKHDVFVSGVPKRWMDNTLKACRALDLEPAIITTAGSALTGLVDLLGDVARIDALVVVRAGSLLHVMAMIGGKILAERIIELTNQAGDPSRYDIPESIAAELRIAAKGLQARYGEELTRVLVLGAIHDCEEITKVLNTSAERIDISQNLPGLGEDMQLACLAAVLGREERSTTALINFRAGEYSYNPKLRELLRAGKTLLPHALLALTALALYLLGLYSYRSYAIHRLRTEIQAEVARVIPGIEIIGGAESQIIDKARTALEADLNTLGAPAKISPTDALIEIARAFRGIDGVTVSSISIAESGATIKCSGEYVDAHKFEVALSKQEKAFCSVSQTSTSSSSKIKTFDFKVALCQ